MSKAHTSELNCQMYLHTYIHQHNNQFLLLLIDAKWPPFSCWDITVPPVGFHECCFRNDAACTSVDKACWCRFALIIYYEGTVRSCSSVASIISLVWLARLALSLYRQCSNPNWCSSSLLARPAVLKDSLPPHYSCLFITYESVQFY